MQNNACENLFPRQILYHANQILFHIKGFARRLVLKQRHKMIITSHDLKYFQCKFDKLRRLSCLLNTVACKGMVCAIDVSARAER